MEGTTGRRSEERYLETDGEGDGSKNLPAWRRHISGLSLGGRQRRRTAAEHGPLENIEEKIQSYILTFQNNLDIFTGRKREAVVSKAVIRRLLTF